MGVTAGGLTNDTYTDNSRDNFTDQCSDTITQSGNDSSR